MITYTKHTHRHCEERSNPENYTEETGLLRRGSQRRTLTSSNRGFTLLLASLIASLMTALGIAMFTIAQKEVRLSSVARDSQFAFYAADAGAECALYLHYVHDAFATSTAFTNTSLIKCDDTALLDLASGVPKVSLGGATQTTFRYDMSSGDGKNYCVSVKVTKSNAYPHTRIHSLGYNSSCSARSSYPRLLERAVGINL